MGEFKMTSAVDRETIESVELDRGYGSLGVQALSELHQCLSSALDRVSTGLLIDCGKTEYFGCGFLNVLLTCHQRARSMRLRIVVCGLNSLPEAALTITQLWSLWRVYRTQDEAIAALESTLDGRLAPPVPLIDSSQQTNPYRPTESHGNSEAIVMATFRVWTRPLGTICRLRVEGVENGRWLAARLGDLVGGEDCEPLGEEEPAGFYTFDLAFHSKRSHSSLSDLLATIPEVELMCQPA